MTRGGLEGLNNKRINALKLQLDNFGHGPGLSPEQAAAIEINTTGIDALKTVLDTVNIQLRQLNTQVEGLQASLDEKDAQIAELSGRPTLEQLQDARTGSLLLSADQETSVVTLEFDIQESDNLRDWVSRPEKITATFPLAEGKKFVRIALSR